MTVPFGRGFTCLSLLTWIAVDPETKRVLNVVLEMTRVSLGLKDDHIELAKAGERNPDLLCEGALKQLREHLYCD
jgi:hypothetical protein